MKDTELSYSDFEAFLYGQLEYCDTERRKSNAPAHA